MVEVEELIEQARKKWKNNDNSGSIALLEMALKFTDKNPTIWNLLGVNYIDLENYDKALVVLEIRKKR